MEGYAKAVNFGPPPAGVVFGLGVTGGIAAGQLLSIINGNQLCAGVIFSLVLSVLIGAVVGAPEAGAMTRFGVSIEAGIYISGCTGPLSIGISAGIAGAVVWASSACTFGPQLGPFGCGYSIAAGLTVFCCTYNVLTQASNCR